MARETGFIQAEQRQVRLFPGGQLAQFRAAQKLGTPGGGQGKRVQVTELVRAIGQFLHQHRLARLLDHIGAVVGR